MPDFELPGFLGPISDFAMSQDFGYWLNLGIDVLLSTIVGGLVMVVILEIVSKKWGEPVRVANIFLLVLLVKVINIFVLGFLISYVAFIPFSYILIPLLIWIGLVKLFFSEMSAMHAVIVGVVGFAISIILIPSLVGIVVQFIPSF